MSRSPRLLRGLWTALLAGCVARPGPADSNSRSGPTAAEPTPTAAAAEPTAVDVSKSSAEAESTAPHSIGQAVAVSADARIYFEPSKSAPYVQIEPKLPPADHLRARKLPGSEHAPRRVLLLGFEEDIGDGWYRVDSLVVTRCGYDTPEFGGPFFVRVADLLPVVAEPWRREGPDGTSIELRPGVVLRRRGTDRFAVETSNVSFELPADGIKTTRRHEKPTRLDGRKRTTFPAGGPTQLDAAGHTVDLVGYALRYESNTPRAGRDLLDYDDACARVIGLGRFLPPDPSLARPPELWAPESLVVGGVAGGEPGPGPEFPEVERGADLSRPNGQPIGMLRRSLWLRTKVRFDDFRACFRHGAILGADQEVCASMDDYVAHGSPHRPKNLRANVEALEAFAIHRPEPRPADVARTRAVTTKARRTTVSFCVTADGKVVDTKVAKGSGSRELDELAREAISRWRFRALKWRVCSGKTFVFEP